MSKYDILHHEDVGGMPLTSSGFEEGSLVCPACGTKQDGVTGTSNSVGHGQMALPQPGSIVICSYCGNINQFDENLQLTNAPSDIIDEIPEEFMELIKKMQTFHKDRPISERRNRFENN